MITPIKQIKHPYRWAPLIDRWNILHTSTKMQAIKLNDRISIQLDETALLGLKNVAVDAFAKYPQAYKTDEIVRE